MNAIEWFFSSREFEPHGYCFLWQKHILFLHVISDAGIALAYYLIPVLLFYFVRKREDLPYKTLFLAFCAFILLCGTTHMMAIWVLWHPDYALEGVIKAATAIVSLGSLFILWKVVPQALSYINPEQGLLAAIVESSHDAIISKTLNGVITTWNNGAEALFGYSAEEAIGNNISLIIPPDKMHEEDMILAKLKAGEKIEDFETVRLAKDGHKVDVSVSISPVYNGAGKVVGISKVARDIRIRKAAETQKQHYTRELERSNQELEDFAHIVSHDLKEPIRGLGIQATLLQEDYGASIDAEGLEKLERMKNLCSRMEHMITDLLHYSKLGRIDLAKQEVDMMAVVAEVEDMMEPVINAKNGRIIIKGPLPRVMCDKPRMTEVFRNLISNAFKYNDSEDPVVEIGCLHEVETPQGVEEEVFYVRDNGPGIDPKFHEDIFQIFKRLPCAESEANAGTGAGLSFVRKILERCNGRIWLESEPGKGTTFYFSFHS